MDAHLCVYQERNDVQGIVHTHSPYASVFAVLGKPIPAYLRASAMLGDEIHVGDLKLIGGIDIGEEIINKIEDKKAIIMQNHGVCTVGSDAAEALKMAVEVEEIARISHYAICQGQPIELKQDDIRNHAQLIRKPLWAD